MSCFIPGIMPLPSYPIPTVVPDRMQPGKSPLLGVLTVVLHNSMNCNVFLGCTNCTSTLPAPFLCWPAANRTVVAVAATAAADNDNDCLLYTSPSPRD